VALRLATDTAIILGTCRSPQQGGVSIGRPSSTKKRAHSSSSANTSLTVASRCSLPLLDLLYHPIIQVQSFSASSFSQKHCKNPDYLSSAPVASSQDSGWCSKCCATGLSRTPSRTLSLPPACYHGAITTGCFADSGTRSQCPIQLSSLQVEVTTDPRRQVTVGTRCMW